MEAFIWILFFKILSWIGSSKEQNLLEIRIFCDIVNVFTVIYDQDIVLLDKILIYLKKSYWHLTVYLLYILYL